MLIMFADETLLEGTIVNSGHIRSLAAFIRQQIECGLVRIRLQRTPVG
jgi:hypothetical protein